MLPFLVIPISYFLHVISGRQICGHWAALYGKSSMAVLRKIHLWNHPER